MAEQKSSLGLVLIALPLVVVALIFFFIIVIAPASISTAACNGGAGRANPDAVPAEPIAGYSGEQLTNAAHIMNAASELHLSRQAQVIGVMTAMGESSLIVLDSGDTAGPDSRGLFQQRDNGAWGSYADRMDPRISANNFFAALAAVPGWESLEPTLAAHKVQSNADPFHYEVYFTAANEVVTALAGDSSAGAGCGNGIIAFPLAAGYNMTDDYGPRPAPGPGASTWHPAVDLQLLPGPCDDPIYAVAAGTVTISANGQMSIKSPEGYTVSYLHMKLSSAKVAVGDTVTPGQEISAVGNEVGSFGCHLDLRISRLGSTNPAVLALASGEHVGGTPNTYGYVDPEDFYSVFGLELCPTETCRRSTP